MVEYVCTFVKCPNFWAHAFEGVLIGPISIIQPNCKHCGNILSPRDEMEAKDAVDQLKWELDFPL